ncbi:hypothetical protein AMTRI_Chr03g48720 [Amborella trichopoda]
MSTESLSAKPSQQVVTLGKALKLAEGWVKNMCGSDADDSLFPDVESRSAGLGLGAKYIPHSKAVAITDPLERKLHAKLVSAKARNERDNVEQDQNSKGVKDDDDNEEDLENRNNAICKKGTGVWAEFLQGRNSSGKQRKRR